MNSINFFNDKKKFPLSTQVLEFIQNMIKQAHKLALVGGADKYIVTGCTETAVNTWAAGYVVINGEILPFLGGTGTLGSSVRIKQTKTDIVAEYDTYEEALTDRYVEFGSNVGGADTFTWSDFVRVKTNLELAAQYATKTELEALSNLLMPKGGIIMWSGAIAAIPAGFVVCNGANIEGFGVVPDLRGRFIVGYDETTLNSPDNVIDQRNADGSVIKNYATIGNRGGKPEVQLTKQESGLPDFAIPFPGNISTIDGTGSQQGWENDGLTNINIVGKSAEKSHENRPPYFVLAYIIKVV